MIRSTVVVSDRARWGRIGRFTSSATDVAEWLTMWIVWRLPRQDAEVPSDLTTKLSISENRNPCLTPWPQRSELGDKLDVVHLQNATRVGVVMARHALFKSCSMRRVVVG